MEPSLNSGCDAGRAENADEFALPLKALADLIEDGDWEVAGALASGIAAKCNRQAKGVERPTASMTCNANEQSHKTA